MQKEKGNYMAETQDAAAEELLELLGSSHKRRAGGKAGAAKGRGWKFWAILGGCALALAGGAVLLVLLLGSKSAGSGAVYREYTVERGDVTVGQSESSSISLDRETVSFPISATVEEVYVKEGSSVKEGDPLVRLNAEDISTGIASYELQLEIAGLELEQAKLQQQTRLLAAEQQLESSKQAGKLASASENVTVAELESALTAAQKKLLDAQEDYDNYSLLYAYFDSAYSYVTSLKKKMNNYSDLAEDYNAQLTSLTTYTKALAEAQAADVVTNATAPAGYTATEIGDIVAAYKTEYDNASAATASTKALYEAAVAALAAGTGTQAEVDNALIALEQKKNAESSAKTAYETINSAVQSYSSALSSIAAYESAIAALGSEADIKANISQAESNYSTAKANYEAAYSSFQDNYGNIDGLDEMLEAYEDAQTALESAQTNLDKTEISTATGLTGAEQKKDSALNEAETAGTAYELTVMELNQAVDAAQEEYDTLQGQIDDIKETIAEDGVVYAPCNGMVASVNVAVDDELTVMVDEDTKQIMMYATLLTMTDISHVYVPITISEEDILSVSIGQQAAVTMTSFPNRTFDAEVDTITVESSRSGAATVSYTVNVVFADDNELEMFEGMSAEVTLIQRTASDVLYINNQAVTNSGGVSTVLVKNADGSTETREIVTGFSDGRYVEIISGLAEGETVLVESALGGTGSGTAGSGAAGSGAGEAQMGGQGGSMPDFAGMGG